MSSLPHSEGKQSFLGFTLKQSSEIPPGGTLSSCGCLDADGVSGVTGGSVPLQPQECGQEGSPGGSVVFGHCWQGALCAGGK